MLEEELALNTEQVKVKNQLLSKGKLKKFIIPFFILVILLGVGYILKSTVLSKKSEAADIRTAVAATKDVNTTITGSGTMTSSNLTNVMVKTSGTLTKINFKQGDKVKKGDVIATLDTTDVTSNLQKAQSNLNEVLQTQTTNKKGLANLSENAPISGQITNIYVNEGDNVQKNGLLFTIINSSKMKLVVPFNGSDISNIKLGNKANINLQNVMQTVRGYVTYISNAPYSTQSGGELYNVEITLNNPGSLTEGIMASADIDKGNNTITSANTGTLSFVNKINVKSDTGGVVEKINARVYDKVKAGANVLKLTNDDLTNSIEATDIKIKDAQEQLTNSKEQLANCSLVAPIDGIVTEINSKVGDTVKMGDVLTSITDTSQMQFSVDIDELDIAKVKVGQNVNITVDALSQTSVVPLRGVVSVISVEGSSQNGVTTYPVTIKVTGVSNNFANLMRNRMSSGNGTGNSGQGFRNWSSNNGSGNGASGQGSQSFSGGGSSQGNGNASGSGSGQGNGNWTRNWSGQGNGSGNSSGSGTNGMSGFRRNGGQGRNRLGLTSMLSELKDGMNANAEILISENPGVLTVPIESVLRVNGNSYVMVKSDAKTIENLKKSGKYTDIFNTSNTSSSSGRSSGNNQNGSTSGNSNRTSLNGALNRLKKNQDYYKDSIPTAVEVGVNNDTDIQIVSGLKAGQIVLLPPIIASQSNTNGNNSGFGMFGAGGGSFGGNGQYRNRASGQSGSNNKSSSRSGGGN